MADLQLYFWVMIGVLLSVLLPIASQWLHEAREDTSKGFGDITKRLWAFSKPYVKVAIASAIVSLLALAVYRAGLANGTVIDTWGAAIVYGYVWDSTLQKIFARPQ